MKQIHRPAARRGFTLVELLVVIGIIAVLIGILVPVVTAARREGMRAKCLSNMRNMELAQWMYVNENRGYLIQGGMAHGGVHANELTTWFNTLNRYYQNKLLPRCPADTSAYWDVPVPASGGSQYRRTSYGINTFLDRDLCPWGPGFLPPAPNGQYVKIEQIRHASDVIQFLEMAYAGEYAGADHIHPDLFATATTPAAAIPANIAKQIQTNSHSRRSGWEARANYAFVDGHVETLAVRDVYQSIYENHFDPASPQPKP